MSVAPKHDTAVREGSWDANANLGRIDWPVSLETAYDLAAFVRDTNDDGTVDRQAIVLPHHFVSGSGDPGAASANGVRNALARLPQTEGLSEADRAAIESHLRNHLDEADDDRAMLPTQVTERVDTRGLTRRGRGGRMVEVRVNAAELRLDEPADDGTVVVQGYPTVYNIAYDVAGGAPFGWSETIAAGAAARSVNNGADVRLLINHEGLPLARTRAQTLTLESDDLGLRMEARLDPTSHSVNDTLVAMRRGDLDEMSFAFEALRDEWHDDYTRRIIREVRLHDVSLVTFPANPHARAGVVDETSRPAMSLNMARAIRDEALLSPPTRTR